MEDSEKARTPWWQTVPGMLTAAAAIITALTGLLIALHQVGVLGGDKATARSDVASPVGSSASASPHSDPAAKPSANTTASAGPQAATQLAASGENILAAEHGGQILLAPNDDWAVVIDGKEDEHRSIKVGEEAVFAFKDEQPATFSSFGMLIPRTGRNPKEFELLVSDESANGAYRSIGTFHPQNVRVMKTGGWQDFAFAPVTAKYLKVKLRSNFEEVVWLEVYEFRVGGR